MQIDAQVFLPIAEKAGEVCFFDTEATGTHGDYNSILVVSLKPWHGKLKTFTVKRPGQDKSLVAAARDELSKFAVWVSYYGKMFDIPLLQSRLLAHRCAPLIGKHHIDLYWHMKAHTLTSRRSQAHLLEWLATPQQKMTLSPEVWNLVLRNPREGLKTLSARCESDVEGLEAMYDRVKHLIVNVTR